MILQAEKESTNNIIIEKNLRPSLISKGGKVMGIISLVTGFLGLFFSIAPYVVNLFSFIFWFLYPLAIISFITAIIAYFIHQIWRPTFGILLSMCAVIVAAFSKEIYVLGMAGSVNALSSSAKIFIDALNWPF